MVVVFHLGLFKTGTTTLQHTFDKNRDRLRRVGVLYPETGLTFRDRKDKRQVGLSHAPDGSDEQRKVFDQFFREIEEKDTPVVLLSSESWCSPAHEARLRRLVRECKARKFETIGIMFMRNRFQFARSHYREWVQNWNNALPFPKYVKERRKQWDFVAIAERMNRIFDGNMHYHSYVPGHDTVKVFTDLLSLPKLAPVQPQNPSLNAIEAEAARLLIEQGVKDYQPHLEAKRTRLLALAGDGGVKAFSEDLDQKPLRETRGEAQRLMQATNLPEDEVRALLDLPHTEAEKIIRLRGDIAREIGLAA